MALKNRTEAKAVVNSWAAILDLEATHKPDLQEVLDNCLFRKDVSDSQVASGTTKTLDFDGFDYIEVTQSNNVAYTLNNILQGEIKFLKITKTAAQTITFANATDTSALKSFINATTIVIYRITNKDAVLYVETINIDKDILNNKTTKEIEIGDWNMDTGITVVVAHGLTSSQWKTLRIKSVTIRNDADDTYYLLNSVTNQALNGGAGIINSSSIILERLTGALFDSALFDSTSYNRGWITLEYTP